MLESQLSKQQTMDEVPVGATSSASALVSQTKNHSRNQLKPLTHVPLKDATPVSLNQTQSLEKSIRVNVAKPKSSSGLATAKIDEERTSVPVAGMSLGAILPRKVVVKNTALGIANVSPPGNGSLTSPRKELRTLCEDLQSQHDTERRNLRKKKSVKNIFDSSLSSGSCEDTEEKEYVSSSECASSSESDLENASEVQQLHGDSECEAVINHDGCSKSSDIYDAEDLVDAEELDSSSITISKTSNRGRIRKYDKKQYCFFCDKTFAKVTKHWYSCHSKEREVIEIIIEKDAKRKMGLITLLRNKGNHIHNCRVLREGKGDLVVTYRPSKEKARTIDDYLPCEHCLGYFSKRTLRSHQCKFRSLKGKGRVATKARMLLPTTKQIKPDVLEIILSMNNGSVKDIVKKDDLIISFASKLFLRHGHEKKELVRARLRELGRFLIEMRSNTECANITLTECIKPQRFRKVVDSVRALAKYDCHSMNVQTPSVALTLGHTFRKCAQILQGQGIETGNCELVKEAKQFNELCDLEWTEEVSSRALKELHGRKRNAEKRIPLTEDAKKLVDYLKTEITDAKLKLLAKDKDKMRVWRHLAEVLLSYLIIFNRRRQGEVSRMKLEDFEKVKRGSCSPDIESCLSKLEQQLCKMFNRVEVVGKGGRTVPVLMDNNIYETIVLLNNERSNAGVVKENKFLFALNCYSSTEHIRGSDCMRKFAVACGAKKPETLRSTLFRKHIATMSQILSMKKNELDMLAQFMGHDIRIHREFYRLPEDTLQLSKLSQLLLAMEKGDLTSLKGQTLDKVLTEMDADVMEPEETLCAIEDASDNAVKEDMDVDGAPVLSEPNQLARNEGGRSKKTDNTMEITKNSQGVFHTYANSKKKTVRSSKRQWSEAEKEAVKRHLKPHILQKKLPQKDEITKCIQAEPVLSSRTWRNVKDFCRNCITRMSYNCII